MFRAPVHATGRSSEWAHGRPAARASIASLPPPPSSPPFSHPPTNSFTRPTRGSAAGKHLAALLNGLPPPAALQPFSLSLSLTHTHKHTHTHQLILLHAPQEGTRVGEHLAALLKNLPGPRLSSQPIPHTCLPPFAPTHAPQEGARAGEHLAALLKGLPALRELHVGGNSGLGAKPAMAPLSAALLSAPELRLLNLSGINLEAPGASALAPGVGAAKRLTDLDVGYNYELGDGGAASLLAKLKGHGSLERLGLSCAGLGEGSKAALLAMMVGWVRVLTGMR
eukprot:356115-Chlamydomonas_euryale.AAC.1